MSDTTTKSGMAFMRDLARKCSPAEWGQLYALLGGPGEPDEAVEAEDDELPNNALEEPRSEGMERAANRAAMDAAISLTPGLARIVSDGSLAFDRIGRRRAMVPSTVSKHFATEFPHIKIGQP